MPGAPRLDSDRPSVAADRRLASQNVLAFINLAMLKVAGLCLHFRGESDPTGVSGAQHLPGLLTRGPTQSDAK